MMHFYSMKVGEVLELDAHTFADLWNGITMIESQDFLTKMTLHSLKDMKPADRKRVHKEHHKLAYPSSYSKQNTALTAKELAEKLAVRARHGQ